MWPYILSVIHPAPSFCTSFVNMWPLARDVGCKVRLCVTERLLTPCSCAYLTNPPQALFRDVAMMVPDYAMIAEVSVWC